MHTKTCDPLAQHDENMKYFVVHIISVIRGVLEGARGIRCIFIAVFVKKCVDSK